MVEAGRCARFPVHPTAEKSGLNVIERLWLRLKADGFWDFIARTPQELSDRPCLALESVVVNPAKTASNCSLGK